MSKKIKNVTIVGGGTSGWFTAAYLSHNTKLNVTIVDKEVGTPVGVGEGTLLGFKLFLEDCGFSESEWFHKIDATYKSGIAFPRFGRDNTVVWHPFILDMEYKKHNSSLYEAMTYVDQERYNELGLYFNISLENLVDLNGLEHGDPLNRDGKQLFFGGANWLCWMLQIEKNIGKTKSINQKIADEIITEWEKKLTEIRNNPKTVHHKSLLMGEQ